MMQGTCALCGCTETTPCLTDGYPCAWYDERQDLCDACMGKVLQAPVKIESLADAERMIRGLRRMVFALCELLLQQEVAAGGTSPRLEQALLIPHGIVLPNSF